MEEANSNYCYPNNPNYDLPPDGRLEAVKEYYMSIPDAVKRVDMYSMDTLAKTYLFRNDYKLLYGELLGFWQDSDIKLSARKITTKELFKGIFAIVTYCEQQAGCQNCILREFGCDHWKCQMYAFELRQVMDNLRAKKKNHGYI